MKLRYLIPALLIGALPLAQSRAFVAVSVAIAPPPIPVYVQPPCPVEGYLWTPGYWGYADSDYYWVPGVWVAPPRIGFLWTPGYWGFERGFYGFHDGYWGPTVGFYGGINYGCGYGGFGYYGGRWEGRQFRYNTAVTVVNRSIVHNTYVSRAAVHDVTHSRVSFNGPGGVNVRPTAQQLAATRATHIPPTAAQASHVQMARQQPTLRAASNHGHPALAAVPTVNAGGANSSATPRQAGQTGRSTHAANTAATAATHHDGLTPAERRLARQNQFHTGTTATTTHAAATQARTRQQTAATQARTRQNAAAPQMRTRQQPVAAPTHARQQPAAAAARGRQQQNGRGRDQNN